MALFTVLLGRNYCRLVANWVGARRGKLKLHQDSVYQRDMSFMQLGQCGKAVTRANLIC